MTESATRVDCYAGASVRAVRPFAERCSAKAAQDIFFLAIVLHQQNSASYRYEAHYPLGRPNDDVAEEIPTHIQPDFKEALRCLFVDAYNAIAESVQACS